MTTEKMYELALQFRGTKLWQMLYNDEIFAVKLSDGEIGYCFTMGRLGGHYALSLYVGDEGYKSYRLFLDASREDRDYIAIREVMIAQDCLQCSCENKEALSDEELEEARQYFKAHNKTPRGKNAFPKFAKYRPGKFPWKLDPPLDEQRICDALSAAIGLKKILGKISKEEMGLRPLDDSVQKIPMLVCENGRWVIRYTKLPSPEQYYPEPKFTNQVLAAHIRRKKKRGIWECGTIHPSNAIQNPSRGDEVPFFPFLMACVDLESGLILYPIMSDDEDPVRIMNEFARHLMETDRPPKTIRCGDDRGFAILKDLCKKAGIQLERTDECQLIDDVLEDIHEHMSEDDEDDPDEEDLLWVLDMLMQMTDDELRQLPREQINMLLELVEDEQLPDLLAMRIKKVFYSL